MEGESMQHHPRSADWKKKTPTPHVNTSVFGYCFDDEEDRVTTLYRFFERCMLYENKENLNVYNMRGVATQSSFV